MPTPDARRVLVELNAELTTNGGHPPIGADDQPTAQLMSNVVMLITHHWRVAWLDVNTPDTTDHGGPPATYTVTHTCAARFDSSTIRDGGPDLSLTKEAAAPLLMIAHCRAQVRACRKPEVSSPETGPGIR